MSTTTSIAADRIFASPAEMTIVADQDGVLWVQCDACKIRVTTVEATDTLDSINKTVADHERRHAIPADMVGRLYEHVSDHEISWLDDLMTSARILWRCKNTDRTGDECGFMNQTHELTCGDCAASRPATAA